jgi:coenzyme F420-reducing hydrogenase beta subunit
MIRSPLITFVFYIITANLSMKGLNNMASSTDQNMKKEGLSLCKAYSQKGTFCVHFYSHRILQKKICTDLRSSREKVRKIILAENGFLRNFKERESK